MGEKTKFKAFVRHNRVWIALILCGVFAALMFYAGHVTGQEKLCEQQLGGIYNTDQICVFQDPYKLSNYVVDKPLSDCIWNCALNKPIVG